MPTSTTWTGGVAVERPALPSFSTMTTVPESATAKLQPETPMPGGQIFGPQMPAGDGRQGGVLGAVGLAELFVEQAGPLRRPRSAWPA